MKDSKANQLGTEKISRLLLKFAVPSIVGLLVNALYNIVDQIFIGQGIGMLGNAATSVSFPLTTICTAVSLLFGIGGASRFNLEMGRRNNDNSENNKNAGKIAGNAISMLGICGVIIAMITLLFLEPLTLRFGASQTVLPYALSYIKIVALGLPFMIMASGASMLVRADGSPAYSMLCLLTGAVLNTILDPLFIFIFDMGISGAALATASSQFVSCILALLYLKNFRSVKLKKQYFVPKLNIVKHILFLGSASCFNQLALTVIQITMNNALTYYGSLSEFGSDIPLACNGVLSKVNTIYLAVVIGLAQGGQPILSYNYGAQNYDRVKAAYFTLIKTACIVSVIFFACFQILPRQILSVFGQGDALYYAFGIRFIRVYMMMILINGIQPVTANFLTSIGKAKGGVFISLTRQVLFLLPLLLLLPLVFGIKGIVYAGPIADMAAFIVSILLVRGEFRKMSSY